MTEIDVFYDKQEWDEVLPMLNVKYGNDWKKQEEQDVTTDYATKRNELDVVTSLTHRTLGTNPKTGDKCTIGTQSRDLVFVHSQPPLYRAQFVLKLVSKNF